LKKSYADSINRGKPGLTSFILVDLEIRNDELYAIPLKIKLIIFQEFTQG